MLNRLSIKQDITYRQHLKVFENKQINKGLLCGINMINDVENQGYLEPRGSRDAQFHPHLNETQDSVNGKILSLSTSLIF